VVTKAEPQQRELRCNHCGTLVGSTTRPQAVPVQCLRPLCAALPLPRKNEDRDSTITWLADAGLVPADIAAEVSLSVPAVTRVLRERWINV
jgi:hypothetical protein